MKDYLKLFSRLTILSELVVAKLILGSKSKFITTQVKGQITRAVCHCMQPFRSHFPSMAVSAVWWATQRRYSIV